MPRVPIVRDRQLGIWLGVALFSVGAVLLWDAYEGRGKSRPFALKFLPG